VIKVERPEGDFARYYDKLAVPRARSAPSPLVGEGWGGGSRGDARTLPHTTTPTPNPSPQGGGEHTEHVAQASITGTGESAYFVGLLSAMLAKADVFVQNLKPGAVAKLGFALEELRRAHRRLVICSISATAKTASTPRARPTTCWCRPSRGLPPSPAA